MNKAKLELLGCGHFSKASYLVFEAVVESASGEVDRELIYVYPFSEQIRSIQQWSQEAIEAEKIHGEITPMETIVWTIEANGD